MRLVVWLFMVLTLVSGCSSSKDATNSNFEKAINKYLKNNCYLLPIKKLGLGKLKFPISIHMYSLYRVEREERQALADKLDALVDIGFLILNERKKIVDLGMLGKKESMVKTYNLTNEGRKNFSTSGRYENGFCAATFEVEEILNFTEPAERSGYTVSNVKYTISPKEVSGWLEKSMLNRVFTEISNDLIENQNRSSTLVLTNNGWVDQSEI